MPPPGHLGHGLLDVDLARTGPGLLGDEDQMKIEGKVQREQPQAPDAFERETAAQGRFQLEAASDPGETPFHLGGPDFQVVALSIDRKGLDAVKPFYAELGLMSLGIYVDKSGDAARALGTVGVPTTLLIDREGRELGRKLGPAEWDSPEMIALLRAHSGLSDSARRPNP